MADKQQGTGNEGQVRKVKGQGKNETGNDTRTSTNNRSRQKKDTNRSAAKPSERNTETGMR